MPELSVVIVATDTEQRTVLQFLVDSTGVAKTAQSFSGFPIAGTDPLLRRIQGLEPSVILLDIPKENSGLAMRAIEVFHQELPEIAIFAVGSMSQPQAIVSAMRSGAREFLERPVRASDLLEAFSRLSAARQKLERDGTRGKIITVINAKGGSGATTVAVNLALALQAARGSTALLDLAPLGHAALHLNLKPAFTVADALDNLHRLDASLLESFVIRHDSGLQLLAGVDKPNPVQPSTSDFARLFDLLVTHFRYLVVDASSRLDTTTRLVSNLSQAVLLVSNADVASLWSANQIQRFLAETGDRARIHLVLNRFRKISGFDDSDAEAAAGIKLLWKIPNQYFAVSAAIDRGVPVMQGHTDMTRLFNNLAARLSDGDLAGKRAAWSLLKIG
jgi:pilus assembly protein CpaE